MHVTVQCIHAFMHAFTYAYVVEEGMATASGVSGGAGGMSARPYSPAPGSTYAPASTLLFVVVSLLRGARDLEEAGVVHGGRATRRCQGFRVGIPYAVRRFRPIHGLHSIHIRPIHSPHSAHARLPIDPAKFRCD